MVREFATYFSPGDVFYKIIYNGHKSVTVVEDEVKSVEIIKDPDYKYGFKIIYHSLFVPLHGDISFSDEDIESGIVAEEKYLVFRKVEDIVGYYDIDDKLNTCYLIRRK